MDKNLKLLESEIKNLSFLLKIGNHNELIKRTSKLISKYPQNISPITPENSPQKTKN